MRAAAATARTSFTAVSTTLRASSLAVICPYLARPSAEIALSAQFQMSLVHSSPSMLSEMRQPTPARSKSGANFFRVVHAVLQTDQSCGGGKQRGERARRRFSVRRFHAEKNYVGAARGFQFGGSLHAHRFLELQGVQQQTVLSNGFHERSAADHHDGRTGSRQHSAEITADRARAHHRDARPIFR